MENALFKSADRPKLNQDLVSFDDCPNHCVGGYVIDPYKHKKEICPYCEEKRKKIARGTEVQLSTDSTDFTKMFNLQPALTGSVYNDDLVLPAFARKGLEPNSVSGVLKCLNSLINSASLGTLLDCSYLINIGSKSCWINFVYPLMAKYYISGRSLTPLLYPTDICRLRAYAEKYGIQEEKLGLNYFDLLDRDVCVVILDSGTMATGILAVKGLMQLRASKGKATIILTDLWGSQLEGLYYTDESNYKNIAKLVTVEYLSREKKPVEAPPVNRPSTMSRSQLSASEFEAMRSAKNYL